MRRLAALLVLACLGLLAAPASATVAMTEFSVVPSETQGGGHPNVTITQAFSYDNTTDSVKDAFVRLQPGLLGNPQSAELCTQEQFAADSCPEGSVVGSVEVQATAYVVVVPVPLTSPGTVYNLAPTGDEPARLGFVVEAAGGLEKIFLQAPVYVRPGADGYGLESTFADQPRNAGLPLQINRIELTLNGSAAKGAFMRMPTSCATGTSVSRANSWENEAAYSERTHQMTPTGCDALPFAPRARGAFGAPGATRPATFPPLSTTLLFDPEHAALNRAEVILPTSIQPSLPGAQRACSREASATSSCPESSRVGTATIDSPLQAQPVKGPVYIAFNTPAPLPGLMVLLPPPVSVRLDGAVDSGTFGTRNVFASNPDLPVRSFTLEFEGGRPDALLTLVRDLCAPDTDTTISVRLVAHNGKVSEFEQALATPGCDPLARVSIRRRGKRFDLVARLAAARAGPGMTGFGLRLPKTLRRGKPRPFVLAGSSRMRPVVRPRLATMPFPGEVRTATVVWRGLKASRELRRLTRVRLTLQDARDKTTTVRKTVRVRGKLPRANKRRNRR